MNGRSKAEKRAAAVLRAQLSLQQALERIDYAEDVIRPKLLEIRAAEKTETIEVEGTLELEAGDGPDAVGLA